MVDVGKPKETVWCFTLPAFECIRLELHPVSPEIYITLTDMEDNRGSPEH